MTKIVDIEDIRRKKERNVIPIEMVGSEELKKLHFYS